MTPFAAKKEAVTYGWFRLCIFLGAGLAILLFANSVWTYYLGSRRVLIEGLRRDVARQVASLDQQIQPARLTSLADLNSLLERAREKDGGKIAWIEIRDGAGAIVAQSGLAHDSVFPAEFVRSQIRSRQPAFKTIKTEAGEVVVEEFPLRLPAAVIPTVLRRTVREPAPQLRQAGIVEIALFLNGRGAGFGPLRRNLLINCSAVFALLLSLTVMSVRFHSSVQGKQLENQVEIARQVQQDLLGSPKKVPKQFQLAIDYVPAARVGGDFYDVFPVNDNGAAFVLGDVSGKGVPAALLMGVIHGAVRSSPWTESPWQLVEATRKLNGLLCERTSKERFVTMFWSYFDAETRFLHYINAGHFPPFLFRKGAEGPVWLSDGGPILGLLSDARFEQGAIRLEPGDVLVLYSDGVVEAGNPAGEQFGLDGLNMAVERKLDKTAHEIRDHILASVRAFTGPGPLDDDRTLVVVQYRDVDVESIEECQSDMEHELIALAA